MYSAVVAVAGEDTGATLFGPADMQISANTSVKTIEGHYTCHEKAVITKPQNVYILRDVQCAEYIAGSDARFFGETNMDGTPNPNIRQDAQVVQEQIRNRLQFESEFSDTYQSMLSFLSPWGVQQQFMQDNAFSLTGGVGLPWDIGTGVDVSMAGGGSHSDVNFPGGYVMFKRYDNILRLSSIHAGEDRHQKQQQQFVREGVYNNSVCLLGPHRVYSPFANVPFELVPGQGHFGPDALPGDARWRRGEAITAQAARSALVGVEVLSEGSRAVNTYGGI
jgi:hypothetical protein